MHLFRQQHFLSVRILTNICDLNSFILIKLQCMCEGAFVYYEEEEEGVCDFFYCMNSDAFQFNTYLFLLSDVCIFVCSL
uniref:Uncharacterized protein n=1 Tax=Anopheles quadriannulatus TaxID=34691 RepID=A0A182XSG8_ANOQN